MSDTNSKHEKQMQAMVYAIKNYPTINRTKLMKFIFFVDLFAYNNYDYTILEDRYYCLERGPVPDFGFHKTIGEKINTEYFTGHKIFNGDGSYYNSYKLKDNVNVNLAMFTEQEKQLLKLTLNAINKHSATALSDKTHKYRLWNENNIGNVIDMKLFDLESSEAKSELNDFLQTAIYVSPINIMPNINDYPKKYQKINATTSLPVFINRITGEII